MQVHHGAACQLGAGGLQILLFGVMAVEIKRKAPRAHTVLELVRKRWGHVANIVRSWLCTYTEILDGGVM